MEKNQEVFDRRRRDMDERRKEKQRKVKANIENCSKSRALEIAKKREKQRLFAEEAQRKLELEKRMLLYRNY